MVLKPEPIFKSVEMIRQKEQRLVKVILTTPQGVTFNQRMAHELSKNECLTFICGHYEGYDERIRILADVEISIGDYVLTGGELPVMVITDAICRLMPGVIAKESALFDSFSDGLLDYPHYTRPPVFEGMEVPEVLISGNHEKIRLWRRAEAIKNTLLKRPDLLKKVKLTDEDKKIIRQLSEEQNFHKIVRETIPDESQ